MINDLILAWQGEEDRRWKPVGILSYTHDIYTFKYSKGAQKDKNFIPFGRMNDLKNTYGSRELFPLFANRLLSKSRPEYDDYLAWLDLDREINNPIIELARSGGIRATDSLQVFPIPEKTQNGKYEVMFFSHGIRHLAESYMRRIEHLKNDDKLFLMPDIQNQYDPLAIALRTDDAPELVGYCPAFFAADFNRLINSCDVNEIQVSVVKVNINAPIQYRLLCKLSAPWPQDFKPFEDEDFEPIE